MEPNQLTILLGELENSATALQGSLLARDTEGIWRNLERQDAAVGRLGRLQGDSGDGFREALDSEPEARPLLRRGLAVVQANRALSQRFLEVVGQMMQRLGGGQAAAYPGGATGRRGPMLVSRKG